MTKIPQPPADLIRLRDEIRKARRAVRFDPSAAVRLTALEVEAAPLEAEYGPRRAAAIAEYEAAQAVHADQPRTTMSSYGTDLEAQGRQEHYRSLSEPHVTRPAPRGFCPRCGDPTQVIGQLCETCTDDKEN